LGVLPHPVFGLFWNSVSPKMGIFLPHARLFSSFFAYFTFCLRGYSPLFRTLVSVPGTFPPPPPRFSFHPPPLRYFFPPGVGFFFSPKIRGSLPVILFEPDLLSLNAPSFDSLLFATWSRFRSGLILEAGPSIRATTFPLRLPPPSFPLSIGKVFFFATPLICDGQAALSHPLIPLRPPFESVGLRPPLFFLERYFPTFPPFPFHTVFKSVSGKSFLGERFPSPPRSSFFSESGTLIRCAKVFFCPGFFFFLPKEGYFSSALLFTSFLCDHPPQKPRVSSFPVWGYVFFFAV